MATPPGPPPGSGRTEPPAQRDRLIVHLVWEGILGLAAVILVVVFLSTESSRAFTPVLDRIGFIGLVAAGLALSFRTGTPNLAVGSVAAFTGGLSAYLMNEGWSVGAAIAIAVILATVIGGVVGVLVGALSVPAWAATLGAALIIEVLLTELGDDRRLGALRLVSRDIGDYSTELWLGLFLIASVGGGLLWLLPNVRNAFSASRRDGEPGQWGGMRPGLGAVAGLAGSSLLAGLGGAAQLIRLRANEPSSTQFLTTIALAAVLVGGVSVFGRRAGVTGTALGVLVVVTGYTLLLINVREAWTQSLYIGLMILLGLGVSRALESITTKLNTSRPARRPDSAPAQQPPPSPNLFTR
jgi:ribose/xylose/arabinose/galactoside ABC-type transport system permease subunit